MPASRRTRKWWERVALLTPSSIDPQRRSPSAARTATIRRRRSSPSACMTCDSVTSARSGSKASAAVMGRTGGYQFDLRRTCARFDACRTRRCGSRPRSSRSPRPSRGARCSRSPRTSCAASTPSTSPRCATASPRSASWRSCTSSRAGARCASRAASCSLFALGTIGFAGFNLLGYLGLEHTEPQNAAIIVSTMPLATAVVRWARYGERPARVTVGRDRRRARRAPASSSPAAGCRPAGGSATSTSSPACSAGCSTPAAPRTTRSSPRCATRRSAQSAARSASWPSRRRWTSPAC